MRLLYGHDPGMVLIDQFWAGEVFIDTQPLVRSVMDGYNVCIFAYGQTGSGKTHTMVFDLLILVLCISYYS